MLIATAAVESRQNETEKKQMVEVFLPVKIDKWNSKFLVH
jgi:hypothetical protein